LLNEDKTKIQTRGEQRVVLGLSITPNGHITVEKKMKKNIETLFHFYLTDKSKYKDFLASFKTNRQLKQVHGDESLSFRASHGIFTQKCLLLLILYEGCHLFFCFN